MSVLYLIRHGKTLANEEHRYCGSTDLSLSSTGKEELKKITYTIYAEQYITSGMKRANETLQILFGNIPYEMNNSFREIDFGIFEMHTYEELKNNPDYIAWISGNNQDNIPPEGESGTQMAQRVHAALADLEEKNTVLVTHGGVIALIMEKLFPEEGKTRYQWQPQPGHGYAIENGKYRNIP